MHQLGVCRKGNFSWLEKEKGTLQGSLCLPLKSGGFFGTFECTGKGYVKRGTSLPSLEKEEGTLHTIGVLCVFA